MKRLRFYSVGVFCLGIVSMMNTRSAVFAGGDPATTLWFRQPATAYDQSLVLGNGRVGAMVFGGVEEERIVLNEESVWSGSPAENSIPGGYKHLPEIRRLLAEEKFAEANKLTREARHNPFDPHRPCAGGDAI